MSTSKHAVSDFFIKTVANATVTDNTLTLNGRMSRKEYIIFMKIAEILGLVWDRKKKCHTPQKQDNSYIPDPNTGPVWNEETGGFTAF